MKSRLVITTLYPSLVSLWSLIIQLSIQELWLFHFSLHPVLPDFRQLMEVGVEELIHGRVLGQSAIAGNDPVPELKQPASAVRIADILHQVR